MSPRVAICFHLGYNHRFDAFTFYIDNVLQQCPDADIYITYRENDDPSVKCHEKYPNAVILKAINGCDTGAFLLQIKHILDSRKKYDYIFKIHTKSNNLVFNNWIHQLLNSIAGSQKNVQNVLELFRNDPEVGMIGGNPWVLKRDIYPKIFTEICQRNKIEMDGYFIGGTIFWIRFSIIEDIFKNIDINYEYSLCEKGKPSEPSYTHSWERIFGLLVNTCGYRIQGI